MNICLWMCLSLSFEFVSSSRSLVISRGTVLTSAAFLRIFRHSRYFFVLIGFLFYQWSTYTDSINFSSSWFVVLFCSPLIPTYCSDADEFVRSSVGLCSHSFHDVLSLVNVLCLPYNDASPHAVISGDVESFPTHRSLLLFNLLYHKLIIAKHCMTHRCSE